MDARVVLLSAFTSYLVKGVSIQPGPETCIGYETGRDQDNEVQRNHNVKFHSDEDTHKKKKKPNQTLKARTWSVLVNFARKKSLGKMIHSFHSLLI